MVFLPSGDYEFVMMDSFGDGICCGFGEGWYRISNTCGLDTAVYDFDSALDTIPFTLLPCIPPLPGCTNPVANNYNPWANIDNGSCNVFECESHFPLFTLGLQGYLLSFCYSIDFFKTFSIASQQSSTYSQFLIFIPLP